MHFACFGSRNNECLRPGALETVLPGSNGDGEVGPHEEGLDRLPEIARSFVNCNLVALKTLSVLYLS